MRIGIVGGGVGGLALAQALQMRGIEVTVFERDPSPNFRRQGYRVTIHESGAGYLKNCLPAPLFEEFLQSSYLWNGMAILDKMLRPLGGVKEGQIRSRSIDRATLRDILMTGLSDLRFGHAIESYVADDEGVDIALENGTTERFDLLIGADGTRSAIRRLRAPEIAELRDTGYVDIAARLPWSTETQNLIDALGGQSLICVMTDSQEQLIMIPQLYDGPGEDPTKGYLYWGMLSTRERINALAGGFDGEALRRAATLAASNFHPVLREMIAKTPTDDITLLTFLTAERPREWSTSRVILIGDAIHSMPPLAGAGANTAIRDASALADQLQSGIAKGQPLLESVATFERAMFKYGFAAVDRSNSNLLRISKGSRFAKRLQIGAMRLVGSLAPIVVTKILTRSV
jgi:2-polyprenyl-6-methoxyphenol hydroxylase-like FAD-dependent oxidoreductase